MQRISNRCGRPDGLSVLNSWLELGAIGHLPVASMSLRSRSGMGKADSSNSAGVSPHVPTGTVTRAHALSGSGLGMNTTIASAQVRRRGTGAAGGTGATGSGSGLTAATGGAVVDGAVGFAATSQPMIPTVRSTQTARNMMISILRWRLDSCGGQRNCPVDACVLHDTVTA